MKSLVFFTVVVVREWIRDLATNNSSPRKALCLMRPFALVCVFTNHYAPDESMPTFQISLLLSLIYK